MTTGRTGTGITAKNSHLRGNIIMGYDHCIEAEGGTIEDSTIGAGSSIKNCVFVNCTLIDGDKVYRLHTPWHRRMMFYLRRALSKPPQG